MENWWSFGLLSCLLFLLACCEVPVERCPGGLPCTSGSSDDDQQKPCLGTRCPGKAGRSFRSYQQTASRDGSFQTGRTGHHQPSASSRAEATGSAETWGGTPHLSSNATKECKGIECKLPLRMRLHSRSRVACTGEGCPPAEGQQGIIRLSDRAAHFIGEVPEFQYSNSELGAAPLGVQLTCDVKPGENEVPSEDALILQLQLSRGQERFVEALKSQQKTITDLQQKLSEQQSLLVNQQREILEQQRRMYD